MTELIQLPWTEPDFPIWDAEREEWQSGWRLASPDRCLRNRQLLGIPNTPAADPTWQVPDAVAFLLMEERVLLCHLDTRACLDLHGVGCAAWRALAAYGSIGPATDYLLSEYDVTRDRLQHDLSALAESLVDRGFLEPVSVRRPADCGS
jgi:hypothetical protein